MQRFKKYIGRNTSLEKFKHSEQLKTFGVVCNELPESLGDFEEIELSLVFKGEKYVLAVAVLEGKVKRIMFIRIKEGDPDDISPLTEEQIQSLLHQKGRDLVDFFEYITQ
jgi:hypothetical protein